MMPSSRQSSIQDALDFTQQQMSGALLDSAEPLVDHARQTVKILETLHVDLSTQLAGALFCVAERAPHTEKTIRQQFGDEVAMLITNLRKLLRFGSVGGCTRSQILLRPEGRDQAQIEILRKMLLAFAQDIRVVLIRLASRLQTLRWYTHYPNNPPSVEVVHEVFELYAPLANRLGIWQLKWELEDLAFRFDQPEIYKKIASLLDEKRIQREQFVREAIQRLHQETLLAKISAEISGRPKHIYSIWRKMRGKKVDFSQLHDVLAFRVIVDDIKTCYSVLSIVHNLWHPVPNQYDDYIARPKQNGYQSLHTVVIDENQRTFEVQIRTRDMHYFAEYGMAAHWRYKEADARGYAGNIESKGAHDKKIAWLRQLLAWKDDIAHLDQNATEKHWEHLKHAVLDDHIYVLTPEAHIIPLPIHSTPIDFAYHLHTEIGHCCRGARVDGILVPLNTALQNGQTVSIIKKKHSGPSKDWLNPQLGYVKSQRARQKIRSWFYALDQQENSAQGKALVEKILKRENKNSIKLDSIATQLGFKNTEQLFIAIAKNSLIQRHFEYLICPRLSENTESLLPQKIRKAAPPKNADGILVVDVDALITQLAKCCKPVPPDAIIGFITRSRGVSIHRSSCINLKALQQNAPERIVPTTWSKKTLETKASAYYLVDIVITANEEISLLRDIYEILTKEKINVVRAHASHQDYLEHAILHFTLKINHINQLRRAFKQFLAISNVLSAYRL